MVVSATGLREGGNPWLLRIQQGGQVTDAVLKTAAPEGVAGMATGIDLSSLRLDAALTFGQGAAGPVLEGWEERSGGEAADLAYWDAVAALNMPGDMAGFMPVIHDQGRPDLTANELNTRRDAFLRAALDRL